MSAVAKLRIDTLSVQFSGSLVIDRLSLAVAPGEFVVIVGPSGCGKSTLLRVACGLIAATAGAVWIDDARVTEPPPKVGFMFQRDTLLPWQTVEGNVAIACELAGLPRAARPARIAALLGLVRLTGYARHYPSALSGGMRQRVSLARLLAYEPDIYLMDEPFGALDSQTKIVMGRELLRIWDAERRSIVFVTHDIEEAVTLADRVVVMGAHPGRIVADHPIGFARPRDGRALRTDPHFSALCQTIWTDLALPD